MTMSRAWTALAAKDNTKVKLKALAAKGGLKDMWKAPVGKAVEKLNNWTVMG
jgi:hypothetical protein